MSTAATWRSIRSIGRAGGRHLVLLLTVCLLAAVPASAISSAAGSSTPASPPTLTPAPAASSAAAAQDWSDPGAGAAGELDAAFRSVIGLRGAWAPVLSPDGRWLAYSVEATEWEDNRFDDEIWVAPAGGEPYQLTRTAEGGSSGHEFSPDGRWLAFVADRGEGRQIWLIRPDGGEARQLTSVETGVNSFDFSPDGGHIAFTSTDPESERGEALEDEYGDWHLEDAEFRMSHLWVMQVPDLVRKDEPAEPRRLTGGDDGEGATDGDAFTVGSFDWSPDGSEIVFDHRPTPQPDSFPLADISVVDVETGEVRALVAADGPDSSPWFSPDGGAILYSTSAGNNPWYGNTELAVVPAAGGEPRVLTAAFDEDPRVVEFNDAGVWFVASQRTRSHLFHLDPGSGAVTPVLTEPEVIGWTDISADGSTLALAGFSRDTLPEIWRTRLEVSGTEDRPVPRPQLPLERVTDMTAQIEGWPLGTREVISWESEDGTGIEGVLYKPEGFDPGRRYPLLVIIHGGPTGTSRPQPIHGYVYPVTQWLQKGGVVLEPNYRGSAGYGEAFRSLNVRNLGVGDMWDVMSGVQHLIDAGIADPDKLGAMGWSQGGYISAFLATNTDRFAAISVGAGISNWVTYYVNTDIHGFTRQYLQATPWDDPEIYARTSPMTNITRASTPTLIQHGEFDARVPTPNAYELYQGLRDQGVETELVIYEGFGHGIDKPKERLAATWHNWIWFARYLWGEEWQMPVDAEGVKEEEKG